jgi:Vasohibin
MVKETLPIKCMEAAILGIYLTNGVPGSNVIMNINKNKYFLGINYIEILPISVAELGRSHKKLHLSFARPGAGGASKCIKFKFCTTRYIGRGNNVRAGATSFCIPGSSSITALDIFVV